VGRGGCEWVGVGGWALLEVLKTQNMRKLQPQMFYRISQCPNKIKFERGNHSVLHDPYKS
jgi:hypothetical protein